MAKNLVKWFKKTVRNVVDPQRQERVSAIAEHLYRNLQQHRKTFDLKVSLGAGDLADNEVIEAKEAVFTRILDRVWDDNIVTEKELRTIKWVQQALELDDKNAGRIREQYAKERFQVGLAKAMEDGVLDDEEIAHLNHIAATMNRTMGAFARQFFRTEGEGFVRGMFLASVEGEALSQTTGIILLIQVQA